MRARSFALVALVALVATLSGCTPVQKQITKGLVDLVGPFACAELAAVSTGTAGEIAAQLCPGLKTFADEMLSRPGASRGACGRHLVVLDARGERQGVACEELAGKLATKIGGRTVEF